MPSIKDCKRLVKRIYLTNLGMKKGLAITTLLSGPHGTGKTQVLESAAEDMGGYCLTIEGGSLKEGEITGLPFAREIGNGKSEVQFIPYYSISNIQNMEEEYYKRAIDKGFNNGRIKLVGTVNEAATQAARNKASLNPNSSKELLDEIIVKNYETIEIRDASGKVINKIHTTNELDRIVNGDTNKYKFGEELDLETKLALIETGEIKPVFLFIDELTRTEQSVQKELMNIILTRCVNGYNLPWFVCVVSATNPNSGNSSYDTNDMDPAQLDRFLKLKASAKLDDWVEYALNSNLDADVISAIAANDDIFKAKDDTLEDTDEMTPSPRSWEMVNGIYTTIEAFNNSKFFTPEERKCVEDDRRVLISGKVGATASRIFLQNINNKDNTIKPGDILTGKSREIKPEIVNKFKEQKLIRQKITSDSVLRYVQSHICEYETKNKSTDLKVRTEYSNFISQLKEFCDTLDGAMQLAFAKKTADFKNCKATDGKSLFTKIASKCFAQSVLKNLSDFKKSLAEVNPDTEEDENY